jgi:hypothetical protein
MMPLRTCVVRERERARARIEIEIEISVNEIWLTNVNGVIDGEEGARDGGSE